MSRPSIEAQANEDHDNEAVEIIHSDPSASASRQRHEDEVAANTDVELPDKFDTAAYEQGFVLDTVDDTAVGGNNPSASSSSWLSLTHKRVMGLATLFVVIFAITTGIGASKIATNKQASLEAPGSTAIVQSNKFWDAQTKSGKAKSGKVATCIIQPIQVIFSIKPSITCDSASTLVPPTEKQFDKLYNDYMKECKDFWSHLLYRILIAAIAFWEKEKCDGGNDCSARSLPEECQLNLVKVGMLSTGLAINETSATEALIDCVEALTESVDGIVEIADFPSSN